VLKIMESLWPVGAPPRTPPRGLTVPGSTVAGGEWAWAGVPKNSTPALGPRPRFWALQSPLPLNEKSRPRHCYRVGDGSFQDRPVPKVLPDSRVRLVRADPQDRQERSATLEHGDLPGHKDRQEVGLHVALPDL